MHLSRITIENFRNFSKLDVALDGNVVVVGENKVGKSNLMHALRLLFDSSLPDNARQLGLADFWDGLDSPEEDDKILVSVEVEEFDNDLDILAFLTDFRLDDDSDTVRLTYECRARPDQEMDDLLQSQAPTLRPWRQTPSRGLLAEKRRKPNRSAGAKSSLIYAGNCPRIGE